MEYVVKKHKNLKDYAGVYALKLLRMADGTRIPFEEISGFKINKYEVHGDMLCIHQIAAGYEFKHKRKHVITAKLWLHDLIMINVYDHRTEFFSGKSIDFVYIENSYDAKVQMLQEWLIEDPGIIRAQWAPRNDRVERLLDELSMGRKVEVTVPEARLLDLRGEEDGSD